MMTIFMERLQKLMDERNLTDKELREQCGDISKNNIDIQGRKEPRRRRSDRVRI